MHKVLVVGGGQAACQLVASLREGGFDGHIDMLAAESHLPYQRPPLSKGFLKDANAAVLLLRSADWYRENQIEPQLGVRATRIDRERQQVHCDDGRVFGYDDLILATGVRNAVPPIDGVDQVESVQLRTLDDAQQLRDTASGVKTMLIIGGGFIGLEAASYANSLGIEVTVLERESRLMARAVSAEVSARALEYHHQLGVQVRLNSTASRIRGGEHKGEVLVELADGQTITTETLLLATGVIANDELAAAAGLNTDRGVVVDETLRTSDPRIFAIGDCARHPLTEYSNSLLRLESVQAATDQARCVARQILQNTRARYSELPWFWSDQGRFRLQIVGLAGEADNFHTVERSADKCVIFGFSGDQLVSVETINSVVDHQLARRLLKAEAGVSRAALQACHYQLKALLPQ